MDGEIYLLPENGCTDRVGGVRVCEAHSSFGILMRLVDKNKMS